MAEESWKDLCRPCTVNGENAIWHRWVEVRECITPGLTVMNEHPGGFVCDTFALVEFKGGAVKKVPVSSVTFLGNERIFDRNEIFHQKGEQHGREVERV